MVASLEVGKEVEADDGNGVVTGEVDAWALSPPRTFAVVTSVFPSFLSFTTLTLPSSFAYPTFFDLLTFLIDFFLSLGPRGTVDSNTVPASGGGCEVWVVMVESRSDGVCVGGEEGVEGVVDMKEKEEEGAGVGAVSFSCSCPSCSSCPSCPSCPPCPSCSPCCPPPMKENADDNDDGGVGEPSCLLLCLSLCLSICLSSCLSFPPLINEKDEDDGCDDGCDDGFDDGCVDEEEGSVGETDEWEEVVLCCVLGTFLGSFVVIPANIVFVRKVFGL